MEPRIHICHVLLSLRPGGLENGVVNVVNGLDRTGFVSSVCCLQEKGVFAERITDERCEILHFGLQPGIDFSLPGRLAREFKRLRADIIHTRNAESFFYGAAAARMAGIPVVHSEHGRVFPEKWHRALVQRWLLRKTARAFAVSRELAQAMVSEIGVAPDRFEVIYNGVDARRFNSRRERDSAQAEAVIGSVGRLVAVKNYALLLRAVQRLPAHLPWRLRLAGEGPERARLEALARELKIEERVEFLGHREDIPAVLGGLDVFVLPSFSEGMSNTLLEAMAAGVAVIASDVGGNSEIIEAGRSGLLFASDDVDAAARHIESLVTDRSLRSRLAAAAVDRVESTFSMPAMLEQYQNLYRSVWRKTHGQPAAPAFAQAGR
jgi:sugar transferase (PEP-CTERM/EpsH1 system associated)